MGFYREKLVDYLFRCSYGLLNREDEALLVQDDAFWMLIALKFSVFSTFHSIQATEQRLPLISIKFSCLKRFLTCGDLITMCGCLQRKLKVNVLNYYR